MLPKENLFTIDDIYALPEGIRAELIDGQIYYMTPPNTKHQKISGELFAEIRNFIKAHHGNCQVFAAPFAVFLDEKDTRYVEPDISVICDQSKIKDNGCKGAPDFIIEIVSPNSRRMDYYIKLAAYRMAGVREYWIVDPMKESVIIYDMANDAAPVLCGFTDDIKVNICPDLIINISGLDI